MANLTRAAGGFRGRDLLLVERHRAGHEFVDESGEPIRWVDIQINHVGDERGESNPHVNSFSDSFETPDGRVVEYVNHRVDMRPGAYGLVLRAAEQSGHIHVEESPVDGSTLTVMALNADLYKAHGRIHLDARSVRPSADARWLGANTLREQERLAEEAYESYVRSRAEAVDVVTVESGAAAADVVEVESVEEAEVEPSLTWV